MMAHIGQEGNNWVFTVPKETVSEDFLMQLMQWVEYLNLVQESELSEEGAWALSESIKESWWKENKDQVLAKIKTA